MNYSLRAPQRGEGSAQMQSVQRVQRRYAERPPHFPRFQTRVLCSLGVTHWPTARSPSRLLTRAQHSSVETVSWRSTPRSHCAREARTHRSESFNLRNPGLRFAPRTTPNGRTAPIFYSFFDLVECRERRCCQSGTTKHSGWSMTGISFLRIGRIIKLFAEGLRSHVVFRSANVDENSMLLGGKQSMIENLGKDIVFQTGGPWRNVTKNPAVENIHTCVNETRGRACSFFSKATHSPIGGELNGSVALFILHLHDRHTGDSSASAVKLDQLPEVHLHEGIAIHYQEVGRVAEERLRKFYGPRGSQS